MERWEHRSSCHCTRVWQECAVKAELTMSGFSPSGGDALSTTEDVYFVLVTSKAGTITRMLHAHAYAPRRTTRTTRWSVE